MVLRWGATVFAPCGSRSRVMAASRSVWAPLVKPTLLSSAADISNRLVPVISSRRRMATLGTLSPTPPAERGRPAHLQTSLIVESSVIAGARLVPIPRINKVRDTKKWRKNGGSKAVA